MKTSFPAPMPRIHAARQGALLALLGVSFVSASQATTLAYWRFEEGSVGDELQSVNGSPSTTSADSSGNGYTLQTFNTAGFPETSPAYSASTPFANVPGTGAANTRAFLFDGNDDIYSEGAAGLNSATSLPALTLEASVNFGALGGYQTFLGKDGSNIPGDSDPNFASVYFQLVQDFGFENHVAIKLHQADGTLITVRTAAPVSAGQWYNFAAVANGSTLSLYSISEGVATLEGSASFAGSVISTNSNWTIGRGMYANNVGDWVADGSLIDEVRISAAALGTGDFLASAIPEPSAFAALGGLAALAFAASRRRRA